MILHMDDSLDEDQMRAVCRLHRRNADRFIGGVGRTGTTLACRIVTANAWVVGLYEPRFFAPNEGTSVISAIRRGSPIQTYASDSDVIDRVTRAAAGFASRVGEPEPARAKIVQMVTAASRGRTSDAQGYAQFVRNLCARLAENFRREIWVEKTPPNALSFKFIKNAMPNAKLLVMARDPIGTCASLRERWWAPSELTEVCAFYNDRVQTWLKVSKDVPADSWAVKILNEMPKHPRWAVEDVYETLAIPYQRSDVERAAELIRMRPTLPNRPHARSRLNAEEEQYVRRTCADSWDALRSQSKACFPRDFK